MGKKEQLLVGRRAARSSEFAQHLGKHESDLSGQAGWFFKRKFAGRLSQ